MYSDSYLLSSAVPSYSSLPLPNEQTIEYSPRGRSSPQLGTIERKWRQVTIVLKVQVETDGLPTYGRNSAIQGEVELAPDESIHSVSAKLEGRLELSITDGGTVDIPVATVKHVLWSQQDQHSNRCPSVLPFYIPFPSTYVDGGRSHKIPPSYEAVFYGIPALTVRCSYSLLISIGKRHSKLGFWKPSKTNHYIHIHYRPRTRPSRPILPISPLFSTIKPLPEEWHQIVTKMHTRPSSNLEAVQCQFLIPSVQTFGLRDTIPFHIQLTAPISSLQHFLSSDANSETRTHKSRRNITSDNSSVPTLRVFVARQVLVEINGRKSWRNSTLGEGEVRSIPPCASGTELASDATADWEGDVRCREDVNSVGFNSGSLIIKDFIVLELTPPSPRTSPLLQLQHAHPIKLVTDTWVDVETQPLDS